MIAVSGQYGRDYLAGGPGEELLLDAADALAAEHGVVVQIETHRHRLLFSPWSARRAVARRPALRLIADLSHYVNVCEAPPGDADLEEAVAELVPRVTHTHARVGHEEGPQVPDVADPRWAACARNDADRVKASLPVVPPLPPPATPLDGAPQRYAAARSST